MRTEKAANTATNDLAGKVYGGKGPHMFDTVAHTVCESGL